MCQDSVNTKVNTRFNNFISYNKKYSCDFVFVDITQRGETDWFYMLKPFVSVFALRYEHSFYTVSCLAKLTDVCDLNGYLEGTDEHKVWCLG